MGLGSFNSPPSPAPSPRGWKQMREVIDFCTEQPEIRSWLDYFDDPAEEEALQAGTGEHEGGQDGAMGGAGGGVDDRDIARQVKTQTTANKNDVRQEILAYT